MRELLTQFGTLNAEVRDLLADPAAPYSKSIAGSSAAAGARGR
jgi:hypothetical protein